MARPLVSIVVTNYNYARFLDRCVSSVMAQTYDNIELIVCDNHSSDESFALMRKFVDEYDDRITIVRHRSNIGSASNFLLGQRMIRGDYFINLGADDYLESDYIATAMALLQEHPSASQLISHANSIDDDGRISARAPFFDGSYLMRGMDYAPILMMASVTSHTSQTIFAYDKHMKVSKRPDFIYSTTLGERTTAMMHAVNHDVIYLDKAFVVCRDSPNNETARLNADLSQIIEQWSVINAFDTYARLHGLSAIYERKPAAIRKLGELCRRYAADFVRAGRADVAGRYLGLSLVLDGHYDALLSASGSADKLGADLQTEMGKVLSDARSGGMLRQHSYAPPDNSLRLAI